MEGMDSISVSFYDGLRYYLLAFTCIPYLLMDRSNIFLFIAGIVPGLLCIVFCDLFLDLAGVGYVMKGIPDDGYAFTSMRVFISYFFVSASCLSLNFIIARSDEINQNLLAELKEKNKLIKHQAEERLRASEHKFAKIFQQGPDLMVITRESDLVIYDVNDKASSVMGYRREELLGRLSSEFTFFVNDVDRKQFFEQYALHGKAEAECLWQRKDGSIIHVSISSQQMEMDGEKYFSSVIKDISDRKKAEERFQKSFDLNPDLMVILTEEERIVVEVNSKIESLMLYKRAEIIGHCPDEFNIWANQNDLDIHYSKYRNAGKSSTETWVRKKNGQLFPAFISSTRIQFSGEYYILVIIRDITNQRIAEEEKEVARYSLNERMKELTTLYKTSQILQQEKKSTQEVLQEIVDVLPPGWQYPEITAARITIDSGQVVTKNFSEGTANQSQWFDVPGSGRGKVEIVYLENKPAEVEGPFLAEERDLINMISEMLHAYFTHKHEAEELDKAEANLYATINNTEVFIWSVDTQFKLLSFNMPFAQYMKDRYGIEIRSGAKILGIPTAPAIRELEQKWDHQYSQVLKGVPVKFEENRSGIDFQYSLNPIREGDQVIGISVFAENITDRKTRDLELAEAIKKVGELKLMALRSVMSPHFIFNVLNAIQYYITKNDRLNAINYLSTFSKLMRSVLTHSVSNKITLADEIDMLKNYIHLEMLRFENKFDFNIVADRNVDLEDIEIPSLLIQPYVENAILHGLYNKDGKGTLWIRIKEENEVVIFEIEDDGVGREAATKLRQQNFPSHKSLGVKLTEERLKLINGQNLTSFEIDDLKDAHGPSGTRVTIRISL